MVIRKLVWQPGYNGWTAYGDTWRAQVFADGSALVQLRGLKNNIILEGYPDQRELAIEIERAFE